MNKLPAIGYPCYVQRTLGLSGGKQNKLLQVMYSIKLVQCKKRL